MLHTRLTPLIIARYSRRGIGVLLQFQLLGCLWASWHYRCRSLVATKNSGKCVSILVACTNVWIKSAQVDHYVLVEAKLFRKVVSWRDPGPEVLTKWQHHAPSCVDCSDLIDWISLRHGLKRSWKNETRCIDRLTHKQLPASWWHRQDNLRARLGHTRSTKNLRWSSHVWPIY